MKPLSILFLLLAGLVSAPVVHAQDFGGGVIVISTGAGGGPTVGASPIVEPIPQGGGNILDSAYDAFVIEPTSGTVEDLFVTPGSTLTLALNLEPLPENSPVHALSVAITDVPYLTLSDVESALPTGWSTSFTGDTFTASNVSGADLSDPSVDLALLTYSVAPDAPIGSVLTLPRPSDFTLADATGNPINSSAIFVASGYGATVVTAPEPSSSTFALTALFFFLALRRRFSGPY